MTIRDEIAALPGKPKHPADTATDKAVVEFSCAYMLWADAHIALAERLLRRFAKLTTGPAGYCSLPIGDMVFDARAYLVKREAE
jgi:aldehyde:ferredoxin oxidoreductase